MGWRISAGGIIRVTVFVVWCTVCVGGGDDGVTWWLAAAEWPSRASSALGVLAVLGVVDVDGLGGEEEKNGYLTSDRSHRDLRTDTMI